MPRWEEARDNLETIAPGPRRLLRGGAGRTATSPMRRARRRSRTVARAMTTCTRTRTTCAKGRRDAFATPSWQAVGFVPAQPHVFLYKFYERDGQMVVYAEADQDCDDARVHVPALRPPRPLRRGLRGRGRARLLLRSAERVRVAPAGPAPVCLAGGAGRGEVVMKRTFFFVLVFVSGLLVAACAGRRGRGRLRRRDLSRARGCVLPERPGRRLSCGRQTWSVRVARTSSARGCPDAGCPAAPDVVCPSCPDVWAADTWTADGGDEPDAGVIPEALPPGIQTYFVSEGDYVLNPHAEPGNAIARIITGAVVYYREGNRLDRDGEPVGHRLSSGPGDHAPRRELLRALHGARP